jgi:hypothetical protein
MHSWGIHCFCTFCMSFSLSVIIAQNRVLTSPTKRLIVETWNFVLYFIIIGTCTCRCVYCQYRRTQWFSELWWIQEGWWCEISCAQFSSEMADHRDLKLCTMLYNHSLVDVHIVRTRGSNYFSLSYGESKRGSGVKYLVLNSPLRWLITETWNFAQCFIIIHW